MWTVPQGSSSLATLGWSMEPLRGSLFAERKTPKGYTESLEDMRNLSIGVNALHKPANPSGMKSIPLQAKGVAGGLRRIDWLFEQANDQCVRMRRVAE